MTKRKNAPGAGRPLAPDLFGGCTEPCANCPYRRDAPLALWSREEFIALRSADGSQFGTVYGCHKRDGTICRGFFLDQKKRGYPSLALRVKLSGDAVSRDGINSIKKPPGVRMFSSIAQMIKANFPEL